MNQVGQVLNLTGTVVTGRDISYVWRFWDNSTKVTVAPFVQKILNQGGTLPWSVLVVDGEGNTAEASGTVVVNAPPIIHSVTLSANDQVVPYSGSLTTVMSDPEAVGNVVVYLDGVTQTIVSGGTATLAYTVATSRTMLLSGTDVDGGISYMNIGVRAAAQSPIDIIPGDVEPRVGRIGPLQAVKVSAWAIDQGGAAITSFQWGLAVADNWATGTTHVTVPISLGSGGGYQSSTIVPVSGELPGQKVVQLTVTTASASAQVEIPVTLAANAAPVIESISAGSRRSSSTISTFTFFGTAADPEGDLISHRWFFFTPPGVTLYGNPATVTSTSIVAAGTLTVTDVLGASATASIPEVVITSSLTATGVAGQAFTHTILAMGAYPLSYSTSVLPTGLSLVGNVISGTPPLSGSADITIQVFNTQGSDIRTLKLAVLPYAPPPPVPSNFTVNGQVAPVYSNGQSLALSWMITNDITSLPTPSTVIEFRDTLGAVKYTIEISSTLTTYTLLNANLQSLYGGQPNMVIRLYAKRAGTLSSYFAEAAVARV